MLVKTNRYMKMHGETIKIIDTLCKYLCEEGYENLLLFFEAERRPR